MGPERRYERSQTFTVTPRALAALCSARTRARSQAIRGARTCHAVKRTRERWISSPCCSSTVSNTRRHMRAHLATCTSTRRSELSPLRERHQLLTLMLAPDRALDRVTVAHSFGLGSRIRVERCFECCLGDLSLKASTADNAAFAACHQPSSRAGRGAASSTVRSTGAVAGSIMACVCANLRLISTRHHLSS